MADLPAEEAAHQEKLVATLQRRLRVLEIQAVWYGAIAIPAHLVLEREDTARQLAQAQAELRRARPAVLADEAPYLGLLTFQERDAEHFFGRDALIADLLERVRNAPFLAVLGPSGSGKLALVLP